MPQAFKCSFIFPSHWDWRTIVISTTFYCCEVALSIYLRLPYPPPKKRKNTTTFLSSHIDSFFFNRYHHHYYQFFFFFLSFFKGLMCCRISLKPELCLKTPNGAILTTGTFEQLTGEIWWPWCTIRFLFCFFPIEFFFGEIHSISPSLITRGSTPNRGRNFYLISYRQQLSIQTLRFFF